MANSHYHAQTLKHFLRWISHFNLTQGLHWNILSVMFEILMPFQSRIQETDKGKLSDSFLKMLRRSKNILCIIIIWYIFWLLFCRLRSYMTVQFITDKRTPQDRSSDWNKQQQGCTILNCFPKGNDSTGLSDVAMILIHFDITCKYMTFLKSKLISNNTHEFDWLTLNGLNHSLLFVGFVNSWLFPDQWSRVVLEGWLLFATRLLSSQATEQPSLALQLLLLLFQLL